MPHSPTRTQLQNPLTGHPAPQRRRGRVGIIVAAASILQQAREHLGSLPHAAEPRRRGDAVSLVEKVRIHPVVVVRGLVRCRPGAGIVRVASSVAGYIATNDAEIDAAERKHVGGESTLGHVSLPRSL